MIAPEAATSVVTDYVDSWDRTSTSTYHLVCSATITNNDTVSRTLLISGTLAHSFPSGIAAANVIRGHLIDSGTSPTSSNYDFQHEVKTGEYTRWNWSCEKQVSLAAGASKTFYLYGWASFYTGTMYYERANLRMELIKR